MSDRPPPLPEPRDRGSGRSAPEVRSWVTLAGALVLLLLAVWALVHGLTVGWFVDVRLIWVVTAVLGTWLAGRTAVAAHRAGYGRGVVRSGWGLAVAGALVLAVDLVPMVLESVPRPARWPPFGERAQRSIQVPGIRATLSHQPGDGERDVAPDAEIVVTVHGASFGPARPALRLSTSEGPRHEVLYDCDRVERQGRRLRCTPQAPLQHDRTYVATFTASVSPGRGSTPVELSWTLLTSSMSTAVRGVSVEGVALRVRPDEDVDLEGVAETVPRRAHSNGWSARVRGDDTREWPISIEADGGLRGVLPTAGGRRLKDTHDLVLELDDEDGNAMARLPLGPITSDQGHTVRLVRGRPLRWTSPEGVVLVFDGKIRKGDIAWVTVERADMTRCARRLPGELGWGGAWRVATSIYSSKAEPSRRWSPRDMVKGPPVVDLLFPAPEEVRDGALVFDVVCFSPPWSYDRPSAFMLRNVGGVDKVDGTRYLTFGRTFPVKGHGDSGPREVEPGKVYDQPLDGHHIMLFERDRAFALIVGDYSARSWPGDFFVKGKTVVLDSYAAPYLAAPAPEYAIDRVTGENRTLAILPVLAKRELELETRDLLTGWKGSSLDLRPVRRRAGAAVFVGDLDELTDDPRE